MKRHRWLRLAFLSSSFEFIGRGATRVMAYKRSHETEVAQPMKPEEPPVSVACSLCCACFGLIIAVGIFVSYCMAIHHTINAHWPCCPYFIVAMIVAIVITFVDRCVVLGCKHFDHDENKEKMQWYEVVVRCILKLTSVASLCETIHQPFGCESDGWLLYLMIISIFTIVVDAFHLLYLTLCVFGCIQYKKANPPASAVSTTHNVNSAWELQPLNRYNTQRFDPDGI